MDGLELSSKVSVTEPYEVKPKKIDFKVSLGCLQTGFHKLHRGTGKKKFTSKNEDDNGNERRHFE